ncbi:TPA: hypothetical protein ACRVJA_001144 [Staphylococcus aureus]|nr:hypothetical protein [Staphylococcus aureus]
MFIVTFIGIVAIINLSNKK